MIINALKPTNDIIIVDDKRYNKILAESKLKTCEINRLAEKKYIDYIKSNEITIKICIDNVSDFRVYKGVVYDRENSERNYPFSISEKVKYSIIDDLIESINVSVDGKKKEIMDFIMSERNKCKNKYDKKISFYKTLSIILCFIVFVILILN